MTKIIALLSTAAVIAAFVPASANAATKHRARMEQPVYAAVVPTNPLIYPVGGAIIGAVIGAAVCPPCTVAGSVLTSGGGALIGGGIGAIGGTVVGAAVTPSYVPY
jgi:outer membrane lipoprotein SlyB